MEINSKTLAAEFRETTATLIGLLEKFTPETFNRKPTAASWNAGDVAEHLLLFDIRLQQILTTATEPANRNPTEKVTAYTARVTNREERLAAPTFLVPIAVARTPTEMIAKLQTERNKITAAIENQDLTLVSTAFPHRFFGEMTAFEWGKFLNLHTHRHLLQLEELLG